MNINYQGTVLWSIVEGDRKFILFGPFISKYIILIGNYSCKTTIEAIHGLMSQVMKDRLFNQVHVKPLGRADPPAQ